MTLGSKLVFGAIFLFAHTFALPPVVSFEKRGTKSTKKHLTLSHDRNEHQSKVRHSSGEYIST